MHKKSGAGAPSLLRLLIVAPNAHQARVLAALDHLHTGLPFLRRADPDAKESNTATTSNPAASKRPATSTAAVGSRPANAAAHQKTARPNGPPAVAPSKSRPAASATAAAAAAKRPAAATTTTTAAPAKPKAAEAKPSTKAATTTAAKPAPTLLKKPAVTGAAAKTEKGVCCAPLKHWKACTHVFHGCAIGASNALDGGSYEASVSG